MTGDRVAEIRARLDAATPGPWFREYSDVVTSGYDPTDTTEEPMHMRIVRHAPHLDSRDSQGIENAELIANAPADLAYLLAEVAALRGRLAAVEALEGDAREELFEGVFLLDEKYNFGVTNSPDMHPGVPEAGDLCGDVLDLFRATVRAALATGEGEDNA